jgi:hypothetical protein
MASDTNGCVVDQPVLVRHRRFVSNQDSPNAAAY